MTYTPKLPAGFKQFPDHGILCLGCGRKAKLRGGQFVCDHQSGDVVGIDWAKVKDEQLRA